VRGPLPATWSQRGRIDSAKCSRREGKRRRVAPLPSGVLWGVVLEKSEQPVKCDVRDHIDGNVASATPLTAGALKGPPRDVPGGAFVFVLTVRCSPCRSSPQSVVTSYVVAATRSAPGASMASSYWPRRRFCIRRARRELRAAFRGCIRPDSIRMSWPP
jgi:hypothetical protein